MGYMDKQPSRMQGLGQGRGMSGSGDQVFGFFGATPVCRLDACNARQGGLERPANNMCKGIGIDFDTLQPTHRTPSATISSMVAPFVIIATIKRDPMDL